MYEVSGDGVKCGSLGGLPTKEGKVAIIDNSCGLLDFSNDNDNVMIMFL